MNKKVTAIVRYQIVFVLLVVLIAVGVVMNVNTGTVNIDSMRIFQIIFTNADPGSMDSNIIWKLRLPRLLTAAIL